MPSDTHPFLKHDELDAMRSAMSVYMPVNQFKIDQYSNLHDDLYSKRMSFERERDRLLQDPNRVEDLIRTMDHLESRVKSAQKSIKLHREAIVDLLRAWDLNGCACELSDCEACCLVEDARDILDVE